MRNATQPFDGPAGQDENSGKNEKEWYFCLSPTEREKGGMKRPHCVCGLFANTKKTLTHEEAAAPAHTDTLAPANTTNNFPVRVTTGKTANSGRQTPTYSTHS